MGRQSGYRTSGVGISFWNIRTGSYAVLRQRFDIAVEDRSWVQVVIGDEVEGRVAPPQDPEMRIENEFDKVLVLRPIAVEREIGDVVFYCCKLQGRPHDEVQVVIVSSGMSQQAFVLVPEAMVTLR